MNKIVIVCIAIAAMLAGVLLFSKLNTASQPEHALYYQQSRNINNFTMTDHQGEQFGNEDLIGKWSWVFFGYTSCPDVCPTTLQEINFVYDELKEISANTQVLLVSVDPRRDSQDVLANYIAYFNKEFKALRADHSVLFPFARNLGLMYAITDDAAGDGYLVDHSASMVLINPNGKIAAIFKPKQALGELPTIDGQKLLSDFDKIVQLN
ncbi:SCO family protein [Colwelliaceae bacterium 6471]